MILNIAISTDNTSRLSEPFSVKSHVARASQIKEKHRWEERAKCHENTVWLSEPFCLKTHHNRASHITRIHRSVERAKVEEITNVKSNKY